MRLDRGEKFWRNRKRFLGGLSPEVRSAIVDADFAVLMPHCELGRVCSTMKDGETVRVRRELARHYRAIGLSYPQIAMLIGGSHSTYVRMRIAKPPENCPAIPDVGHK